MKTLKYLVVLLSGLFIIAGCAKELSLETGFSGGNADGDLVTVSGQCATIKIGGQYVRDTVLNNSHFIDVQISICTTGII